MADPRELVRRFNDEVDRDGNLEPVEELVHEDFVNVGPSGARDREGLTDFLRAMHAGMDVSERPVERIVVEGDQVAWRWSMRAVHTGELMGIPPTGNEVQITGNDIAVVRDGKLAKVWYEFDMLDLMVQLGAMEAPRLQGN